MKPLKTILATLGLSLLLVGAAGAQGGGRHGHEGGRSDHGGGRAEAFQPRGGGRGFEERGFGGREFAGRPMPTRPTMGGGFAPRGYARPYDPGYAQGYGPPGRGWSRGQFLPRGYWAGQSADPRLHRLRTPPPGYGWYGVGPDAYLVQRSTGLILDTAPGAW